MAARRTPKTSRRDKRPLKLEEHPPEAQEIIRGVLQRRDAADRGEPVPSKVPPPNAYVQRQMRGREVACDLGSSGRPREYDVASLRAEVKYYKAEYCKREGRKRSDEATIREVFIEERLMMGRGLSRKAAEAVLISLTDEGKALRREIRRLARALRARSRT
jgi:hypothetical protein